MPLTQVVGGLTAGDPLFNALLSADTDGPGPSMRFLPLALPLVELHQSLGDLENYGSDFLSGSGRCFSLPR